VKKGHTLKKVNHTGKENHSTVHSQDFSYSRTSRRSPLKKKYSETKKAKQIVAEHTGLPGSVGTIHNKNEVEYQGQHPPWAYLE
jgi:hypothetical protein